MVAAQKKIKDYLNKSMRKLKHRKGFGVHSPFAYSIITEVIEEKLPYYAYHRMQPTYRKQAPLPFKTACLLLRLANRFHCRRVLEIGCDGGFSLLPLVLTDSRLHVTSLISSQATEVKAQTTERLSWIKKRIDNQVTFVSDIQDFCNQLQTQAEANPDEPLFDMIIVNDPTYLEQLCEPLFAQLGHYVNSSSNTDSRMPLIFTHGILPHHPLEEFWDSLCDRDDVAITMDLYDYGLAILKPRFFKQHYIVSF